jgi:hypothetical protein
MFYPYILISLIPYSERAQQGCGGAAGCPGRGRKPSAKGRRETLPVANSRLAFSASLQHKFFCSGPDPDWVRGSGARQVKIGRQKRKK